MDSCSENLIAATEIESAYAVSAVPQPMPASGQPQQLQPSIQELNGIFFAIFAGLAAVFTVAAFAISTH